MYFENHHVQPHDLEDVSSGSSFENPCSLASEEGVVEIPMREEKRKEQQNKASVCSQEHTESSQGRTATHNDDQTTRLIAVMGRLENIPLKDDFIMVMKNHLQIIPPFLQQVLKQLEALVSSIPERCSSREEYIAPLRILADDFYRIPVAFYNDPANAWPMEVLFLICQFLVKTEHSKSTFTYIKEGKHVNENRCYNNVIKLLGETGILTSGKGTLAAIAISMADKREKLAAVAAEMYLIAYDVGMAHRTLCRRMYPDTLKESCAILVFGVSVVTINIVLEHINKGSTYGERLYNPMSTLEVTTIYTSRCFVVSGHPLDLSRLKVMLEELQENAGVRLRWRGIHQRGPQNHSTLNRAVYHEVLGRWQHFKVFLDPKRLKLNVVSPTTGETWDEKWKNPLFANFQQEVAFAITCSPQILHYGLQLFDFSNTMMGTNSSLIPISGEYFSIGHLIAWDRKLNLKGLERHPMLFTPKMETDAKTILRCLGKIATMNRLWREVSPNSKKILNTTTIFPIKDNDDVVTKDDDEIDEREAWTPSVLSLTPRSPQNPKIWCSFCSQAQTHSENTNYSHDAFLQKIHEETNVEMGYLQCMPNVSVLLQVWSVVEYIKSEAV